MKKATKKATPAPLPFESEARQLLATALGLLARDGRLTPVVMMIKDGRLVEAASVLFRSPFEKRVLYEVIHRRVREIQPDCVILLNDAHVLRAKLPSAPGKSLKERAAHINEGIGAPLHVLFEAGDPRVTEAVTITVSPRIGNDYGATVPYVRQQSGPLTTFQFGAEAWNRNEDGDCLGGDMFPSDWKRLELGRVQ